MSITKTGVWTSPNFSDFTVEPDGSVWLHIFHHNNPAEGLFTSSDTFATGVYKDVNRWYDIEQFCNAVSTWEFLLKQADTATSDEIKYRWIQQHNPNTATRDNVQSNSSTITRITTAGYSTSTLGGGIYKKEGWARMCIPNGTSSDWFGAIGSWTDYPGGTPGYPNTTCTTGYMDLYLRIDNTSLMHAMIKENKTLANQFIEL